MDYFDDMWDAVHYRLRELNEVQGKSFRQIANQTGVVSEETIRRIAGKKYRKYMPSYRTLAVLRDKLDVKVLDSPYRVPVPDDVRFYTYEINSYMAGFSSIQCQALLRMCRDVDLLGRQFPSGTQGFHIAADGSRQYDDGSGTGKGKRRKT